MAGETAALLERLAEEAAEPMERIADGCTEAVARGDKLLLCGNGGSAAQCQHLATELLCRLVDDREPYAAIALSADAAFLTACANDYAFRDVFARQVEALGRPGDALVALSTGGNSKNVLRAADRARDRGMAVYGFTGANGGPLADRCDVAIRVPHADPARIQEAHLVLGHLLCATIETRLASPR